ncbi:tRNA (uridine(54)-C5)-methyltransferase TrmA [Phytohalomonas tamaricis]|uniref:tRNA (uridine(54)-C5)-methyltransferase TrmA n=1 Tax=Phytohalomonas tamaricis TaxID=2081032 RepID=UPI000D0B708F|nr:tRNA (uridine(54)-C5)-methyltransferase TrmA [Phytohalomonas tamaricis]
MSLPVVDPDQYQAQLDAKRERISAQFARFEPPRLEVFASPVSHYRMRAEFRLWHDGDDVYYVMFEADANDPKQKRNVRVDQYPVASRRINELMQRLIDEIRDNTVLRRKLFQVEFLTTLSGEALISLIYHRQLDEAWQQQALELQARLGASIIGRARKQRIVLERDHVFERLDVDGHSFIYQQVENSFTQPNAEVAQHMLRWARDVVRPESRGVIKAEGGDMVELYCGNGNFTIALAEHFPRVLATEISRTSVASAQVNLAENNIDNAVIARMSSEEFSAALAGESAGRRVSALELDGYDFSTVLVDPPRAGLDAKSCEEIAKYANIVYISCNPDTLAANLDLLSRTHRIVRFALFDQFPYTDHCECGVFLQARNN